MSADAATRAAFSHFRPSRRHPTLALALTLTRMTTRLYFAADAVNVIEPCVSAPNGACYGVQDNNKTLWSTDGTDAGTTMVKDINPSIGSNPVRMCPARASSRLVAEHSHKQTPRAYSVGCLWRG